MRLIPSPRSVVLRPLSQAERTKGGVYLPEESQRRLDEGKILEVGSELTQRFRVGDRVVFQRYSGMDLKFSSEGIGSMDSTADNISIVDDDDIRGLIVNDDDARLPSRQAVTTTVNIPECQALLSGTASS